MGVFDAFQIPYSLLEREHEQLITDAANAGSGTIIRGGVARGMPAAENVDLSGLPERFREMYEQRRQRWEGANLDDLMEGMSSMEFMLRFTISHPHMSTTIVGTANQEHLAGNLAAARNGELPEDIYKEALRRLDAPG